MSIQKPNRAVGGRLLEERLPNMILVGLYLPVCLGGVVIVPKGESLQR